MCYENIHVLNEGIYKHPLHVAVSSASVSVCIAHYTCVKKCAEWKCDIIVSSNEEHSDKRHILAITVTS